MGYNIGQTNKHCVAHFKVLTPTEYSGAYLYFQLLGRIRQKELRFQASLDYTRLC